MVATKLVDFRKGADGLAALVRETMAANPFSGAVYVFRAKRADRIKLVFWDGTGLCLFAKRLGNDIFNKLRVATNLLLSFCVDTHYIHHDFSFMVWIKLNAYIAVGDA